MLSINSVWLPTSEVQHRVGLIVHNDVAVLPHFPNEHYFCRWISTVSECAEAHVLVPN